MFSAMKINNLGCLYILTIWAVSIRAIVSLFRVENWAYAIVEGFHLFVCLIRVVLFIIVLFVPLSPSLISKPLGGAPLDFLTLCSDTQLHVAWSCIIILLFDSNRLVDQLSLLLFFRCCFRFIVVMAVWLKMRRGVNKRVLIVRQRAQVPFCERGSSGSKRCRSHK